MTRRSDEPHSAGGHAGERKRQFERQRGLTEGRELALPEQPAPEDAVEQDADKDQDADEDGARE